MVTDQQFACLSPLRFLERIPEHSRKRGVGINDLQIVIGDNNGAAGPVGDQGQQCQPFAHFGLGGDVGNECDQAALTADIDAR